MKEFTVDRIEDNIIILECQNKETIEYPISAFVNISEGDIGYFDENNKFVVLRKKTKKRKNYINDRFKKLLKRGVTHEKSF